MRISSAFPSQYLKAADLQGQRVGVTMSHVTMEDIGGDLKPILYFQGKEKGLVLNKTNANTIAGAYGDDTTEWTGKAIQMYEAMVDFQGRQVAAIRVHIARTQPAQPVQPAQPQTEPPAESAVPVSNGHSPNPSSVPVGTVIDEVPF